MTRSHLALKLAAIASGIGLLSIGAAAAYWQTVQQEWCVRFTSTNSQEVIYSRGCYYRQRYKKWIITASATLPEPKPTDAKLAVGFAPSR